MSSKITQFPGKKPGSTMRNWQGFEYIKYVKDVNGIPFRAEHLREYAEKNKYIITLMRNLEDEVILYDFYVKNSDIEEFFKRYFDGKIEGEIIEIVKCNPEILA